MAKEVGVNKANTNLSYFTLRKIIGWSGLLLPWSVWLLAWSYQPSISDYYYTRSGVLFTSVITLVGAFLISYRGYQEKGEKLTDHIITWIGGALIIVVAAVPTPYLHCICNCPTPICHKSDGWGLVHFGSAALFFIAMGYMSAMHFRRGHRPFTKGKVHRNKIYLFCGVGMWTVLLSAGVMIFIFSVDETFEHLILWVEIVLLSLFGTSWLVKGKALVDFGIQKDVQLKYEPSQITTTALIWDEYRQLKCIIPSWQHDSFSYLSSV